jgi:hypothetical protein
VGEMRKAYKILVENSKESDNLGHLGINDRKILKCILKK